MAATKTQAFVLKTQDYRDTSLLAHFYTREFGKIHGIIRGIRDGRARYGSTLEPFSLDEILFYRRRRGGDLHQVTQVEMLDLFPAVREDLDRLAAGVYFVDLVNEIVELEEPNRALFDLMLDALRFLASGASPKRVARVFELKLFNLLGLAPELRACAVCRAPDPSPAFFNAALGGVHCRGCKDAGGAPRVASMTVSKGTLQFMERAQTARMEDLYNVKVSGEVGGELEKILRRFVDFHLPNKLKSVVFMEKMEHESAGR